MRAVRAVCARGRRGEEVRGHSARGGPHVHRPVSAGERSAVRPNRVGRVRRSRLPGRPFLISDLNESEQNHHHVNARTL